MRVLDPWHGARHFGESTALGATEHDLSVSLPGTVRKSFPPSVKEELIKLLVFVPQGTDSAQPHFPLDHLQMPRRGNPNAIAPPTRFKVWISVMKFDLARPFGMTGEQTTMREPTPEDCSGMMRIWDGPLREGPQCKDLNW